MPPRRAGQVIEKVPGQKYLIRVFLGRVNGKKQYASRVVHGTRKQAEQILRTQLTEKDAGRFVGKAKQSLNSYLDGWLKDMAPMTRKPRTLVNDTTLLRLYVRPYLGETRLGDLSPLDIQHWYKQLDARGLAPKTIRLARNVLNAALNAAVHPYRLIPFNPIPGTKCPKLRKKALTVWTAAETLRFLKAAQGHPHEAFFTLLVCCGLRPGEALGLQRQDFDPVAGTIRINRVLVRQAGGEGGYRLYYDEDPKTDNSRRTLYVPEPALSRLKAKLAASPFQAPTDPIFHTRLGQPLDEHNLSKKAFKPLCRAAGVPVIRLYDLRHTHATLMHQAGVDPKVYGSGMGHKNIAVTLDVYTHVLPAVKREAIEKFEAYLQQAEEPARLH